MVRSIRSRYIKISSFIYLVVGFSWLAAPIYSKGLALGPTLISEYEATGMPHAALFRILDAISAAALICALLLARKDIVRRLGRRVYYAGISVGVLSAIDIITSPDCRVLSNICNPPITPLLITHYSESLMLGLTVFTLGIVMWRRDRKWWWAPTAQAVLGITGLVASRFFERGLFGLQIMTLFIETFWLWKLFFAGYFVDRRLSNTNFIRRSIAITLGIVGVATIIGNGGHIGLSGFGSNILFGPGTAWLAQHNILAGFMMMYLARKIYQGNIAAYKISIVLMVMQVIKYSAILPRIVPLAVYSVILVALVVSHSNFTLQSSYERFVSRIKSVAYALAASVITIALLSSLFRLRQPEIWKRSTFSATRIVMRASLLEINSDSDDPLRARLFGQALTAAGIATYAWIITGLFLPSLYRKSSADKADQEKMEELLYRYGTSSEDSYKLWPTDKHYWFSRSGDAGVAYKQYKSFVFALHSPVGSTANRERAVASFRDYCRKNGWKVAWLLADGAMLRTYENAGMRTLKIGASAVVSLDRFVKITSGNKWWRWIRNKNSKLGLAYEQLNAPFQAEDMQQLASISRQWLLSDNRVERTFSLGYYDEEFLSKCIIHVLRNADGHIIAFANQLPSYNGCTQATIDLMRSLSEYEGAMAYLLRETLVSLCQSGIYKTFDLGFVPLAQQEEAATKKAALAITKTLVETFFSASGLRQFKNKFDPAWQENYLAWDGDWLDVPALTQALDKILTFEEN